MTEPAAKPHFTISTAISYPNAEPHIGHAYEAIATDALARFKRLDGHPVYFMTGVDVHGLKMKQTADKQGVTPLELAEKNTAKFKEMLAGLNIAYDDFISTREPRHAESVSEIWRRMEKAGDIYLGGYQGWYSVRDEAFYAESETVLGANNIRLGPQGTPVEWTEEQTYFFRLSKYEKKLLKLYEEKPEFLLPAERRNEIVSFVKGGLQDLSISRTTFDWGIPVPGAPGHIMYVWIDALTNYITSAGFPKVRSKAWKERWPASLHVIGKDITRFHAVYSAGLPDVRENPVAGSRVQPRLFVQQGREDVEVGGQRGCAARHGGDLRRRSCPLFLPAGGAVRPGRQLHARGHRQPHQRGSGERPWAILPSARCR